MTADASAAAPEEEVVLLPDQGDAGFAALMGALVASEDVATTAPGEQPAPAAADGAGQPAAPGQGAGTAGVDPAAPAAGDGGQPGVAPATPAGTGSGEATAGTVDAETLAPKWGEISTALETQTAESAQQTALAEAKAEYAPYFDALNKHPRLLIGTEVPRVGAEGTETLRDSADAAEWQAAVKDVLLAEIKDRAIRIAETAAPSMQSLHQSIELFQNNVDLIPGTRQFDVDLANRFAELAKPYETRVDGKLHGYSIPVQPIINQLRSQLVAERSASPAAAPAPAAVSPAAAPSPAPAEQPQVGIPAKAGTGGESEDFSALFGTIGLPNFRI